MVTTIDDRGLIERRVARGGAGDPADARLRESGVPVWALVGHWHAVSGDAIRVARAYRVPREDVEAALAYYRAHRAPIEARLAANVAA